MKVHVCEGAALFSIKDIQKSYVFCQNGIQKFNGLDLWGRASLYKTLLSTPPPGLIIKLSEIEYQCESQFSSRPPSVRVDHG